MLKPKRQEVSWHKVLCEKAYLDASVRRNDWIGNWAYIATTSTPKIVALILNVPTDVTTPYLGHTATPAHLNLLKKQMFDLPFDG